MRVAHFDCFSGISGDMTVAALLDAGVPLEPIRAAVASLGLPVTLEVEKVRKGGFAATYVRVEAPEEHTHRFVIHGVALFLQELQLLRALVHDLLRLHSVHRRFHADGGPAQDFRERVAAAEGERRARRGAGWADGRPMRGLGLTGLGPRFSRNSLVCDFLGPVGSCKMRLLTPK